MTHTFKIIRGKNDVVTIINVSQLTWMESTLPKLLTELIDRDEIYESVDDNRIKQWIRETKKDEIEYWKRRIPEVRRGGDQRFAERELLNVWM